MFLSQKNEYKKKKKNEYKKIYISKQKKKWSELHVVRARYCSELDVVEARYGQSQMWLKLDLVKKTQVNSKLNLIKKTD